MIDTGIINLVTVLAILVIEIELNYDFLNKERKRLFISNTKARSSLASIRNNYKFKPKESWSEEERTKDEDIIREMKILNEQDDSIVAINKKIDKYKKSVNIIRLILPILITLEVLHLILQKFEFSFYEGICIGCNKFFLIFITIVIVVFFIIITLIRYEIRKYSEYINKDSEIITKYLYGMQ